MKVQKLILNLIILASLLILSAGCGDQQQKETADTSINAYCEAFLHLDQKNFDKIGESKVEYIQNYKQAFINSFKASSGNVFSDEQAVRVYEALTNKMQQIDIKTKVLSSTGNEAKVEVRLQAYDMSSMNIEQIVKQKLIKFDHQPTEQEVFEVYTDELVNYINNMNPSKESVMTVDCKYNNTKEIWEPKDINNFEGELAKVAINM